MKLGVASRSVFDLHCLSMKSPPVEYSSTVRRYKSNPKTILKLFSRFPFFLNFKVFATVYRQYMQKSAAKLHCSTLILWWPILPQFCFFVGFIWRRYFIQTYSIFLRPRLHHNKELPHPVIMVFFPSSPLPIPLASLGLLILRKWNL